MRWIGAAGGVLGLLAMIVGGIALTQASGDEALLPVQGEVLEVTRSHDRLLVRSNSPNAPSHEHAVRVRYRWTVDGVTYEGDRYAFDEQDQTLTNDDEADARVAALASGKVEVLVDPDDPANAVLARRNPEPRIALTILGGVMFLVGLGFAVRKPH